MNLKKINKFICIFLCLAICITAISGCVNEKTISADSTKKTETKSDSTPSKDINEPPYTDSAPTGTAEETASPQSPEQTSNAEQTASPVSTETPSSASKAQLNSPAPTITKTPGTSQAANNSSTVQPTASVKNTYTIYKYTPTAETPLVYSGTNLALNKSAYSNSILTGYSASNAFDGNKDTIWASTANDKNPYLQVDLGRAYKIGAVEVVHRQDADHSGERNLFEIQVSNDSSFNTYKVIGSQGTFAFKYGWSFIANCSYSETFRYVRLQRTNGATHMTVAEMIVYSDNKQLPQERSVEQKQDGAMQIISKTTGKALSVVNNGPVLDSYSFRNSQRWIFESAGSGYFRIKNCATNKYLICSDYKLSFAGKSSADSQLWLVENFSGSWSRITSKAGGVLCTVNGALAIYTKALNNEAEKWDISAAYIEDVPKSDTSWMQDGYGVMYHLLADAGNKSHLDTYVDVNRICQQLTDVGASYMLLTFGQNSGYFISPNSKFSTIVPYYPNTRFTQRDIFREFALNLKNRGIKLIAYVTASPPYGISSDPSAFLNGPNAVNSVESAMLWSMVLREWSLSYGDLISGWWMDGAYSSTVPTEDILTIYTNALKAGNPNAAVAFNPGILIAEHGKYSDFTAGETDYPFTYDNSSLMYNEENWLTPQNNPVSSGTQWFMLTFLDIGWCHNRFPRQTIYSSELWGIYVKTVLNQGGAICLDVNFSTNAQDGYTMLPTMYNILKEIKHQYYG